MKIKISNSMFEGCKEIVIIYWDNVDELKVFVKKDDVEIAYPYSHRTAFSYLENFEIILEEYPDYISYVTENQVVKIDDFSIEDKNFLIFIDDKMTKLYFSSLSYPLLKKLIKNIKRVVTKGIRIDVR